MKEDVEHEPPEKTGSIAISVSDLDLVDRVVILSLRGWVLREKKRKRRPAKKKRDRKIRRSSRLFNSTINLT